MWNSQEGMVDYFEMLWKTPGLLSPQAVVAVDMTPFKAKEHHQNQKMLRK